MLKSKINRFLFPFDDLATQIGINLKMTRLPPFNVAYKTLITVAFLGIIIKMLHLSNYTIKVFLFKILTTIPLIEFHLERISSKYGNGQKAKSHTQKRKITKIENSSKFLFDSKLRDLGFHVTQNK